MESFWDEVGSSRYYESSVDNGIDNYYTNIKVRANGQTITDLESAKYSIPNVSSTTLPTLAPV